MGLLTDARPFTVGDRVEAEGIDGTITVRMDVGRHRQALGVQLADGCVKAVVVDSRTGDLIGAPVDRAAAVAIARHVVAGADPRIPVAAQLSALAAAVLVLGGAA